MSVSFKGKQYPAELILQAVRYYVAYALSFRDTEEIFKERGLGMALTTLGAGVCSAVEKGIQKAKRQGVFILANG